MSEKSEFTVIGTNTLDPTKLLFSSMRGLSRGVLHYKHAVTDADEYLGLWTSNTEKMRFLGTGGVTMKTSSASSGLLFRLGYDSLASTNAKKYEVSMSSTGDLIFQAGTNSQSTVQFKDASGFGYVYFDSSNKRVGINKENPVARLHVGGDLSVDGNITVAGSMSSASESNAKFKVFNTTSGPSILAKQAGSEPVVHFINTDANPVINAVGTIGNAGATGKVLTLSSITDYDAVTIETELVITGQSKKILCRI